MITKLFLQKAMARLIQQGVWWSDAAELLNIIFADMPVPQDWQDEWYDPVRTINATKLIPIPTYKPIW